MKTHLLAYAIAVVLLGGAAVLLQGTDHHGTPSLHTLMESIAGLLALVVGGIAALRYMGRRDLPYLFIGAAFMGAGLFDLFHAWASSVYAYQRFPSTWVNVGFWTWTAGRLFLGAMLVLSGWAWWWGEDENKDQPVRPSQVYLVSAILLALVVVVVLWVPLPGFRFEGWPVPRPQEFVSALLFLGALVGFFAMGRWRAEPAEHWLVLSIIVAFGTELVIMPFSQRQWDGWFDMAHLLKITSYLLALVGLLLNVHVLQRKAVQEERHLSETNLRLEREIIRRSEAEAHAARESELLESVFNSLSDGVVVADASGKMTRFNRAAEEMTGRSLTQLDPQAWAGFYGVYRPDKTTPIEPNDVPLLRALRGETFHNTGIYLRHEGRPEGVHVSVSGSPVRGPDGRLHGGVVIMRDVTTDQEIQEQLRHYTAELERRNQDLEDFATIVSHDLKEPLRKVLAFGERLESKLGPDIPPDAADHLRRMRQAAERMRFLIDDLLAYTRLNELQSSETVALEEVAKRAVQDLEEQVNDTHGEVIIQPIGRIECDPVQMYQVFCNLIGNGLKYHRDDAPPRVTVSGGIEGTTCRITVEDNGIGFEMKYADRIFRPFHRLHTRSQYEGSGIGLAIVRKIVEQHGGRVKVDSRPGRGTTFTILIPVKQKEMEVTANVE